MQNREEALKGKHLLAVSATPLAAAEIAAGLRAKGYKAAYFSGEELAETVDATGEKGGLLAQVLRLFQGHLSEELNFLTHYQEEAQAGHGVIAVHLDDRDEAQPLAEELAGEGAYNVRLFTALNVVDLTPESNTQAFSETGGNQARSA